MFLKLHSENPNPRYIKMIIECLENDELDCDCENCQYVRTADDVTVAEVEA